MTTTSPVRSALMVGGPAHGRWIAIREGQHDILIPYLGVYEAETIRYAPRDLLIFGRVLRVWAPVSVDSWALSDAAFDLLLTADAKGAVL